MTGPGRRRTSVVAAGVSWVPPLRWSGRARWWMASAKRADGTAPPMPIGDTAPIAVRHSRNLDAGRVCGGNAASGPDQMRPRSGQRAHLRLAVPLAGLGGACTNALPSPASSTPASLPIPAALSSAWPPASAAIALRWPKASRTKSTAAASFASCLPPSRTAPARPRRTPPTACRPAGRRPAASCRRPASRRRSSGATILTVAPASSAALRSALTVAPSEPSATRMPTARPSQRVLHLADDPQGRRRRHVDGLHRGRRRRRQRVHAQAVGDALGQVGVDVAQVADDRLAHVRRVSTLDSSNTSAEAMCACSMRGLAAEEQPRLAVVVGEALGADARPWRRRRPAAAKLRKPCGVARAEVGSSELGS